MPDDYKAWLQENEAQEHDASANQASSSVDKSDSSAADSDAEDESSSDHVTEVADRAVERVEKRKTVTVPAIVLPSDTTEGRTLQELFRVSGLGFCTKVVVADALDRNS